MDDKLFEPADLSAIAGYREEGSASDDDSVKAICDEVGTLASEFHDFIDRQKAVNRLNRAESRLANIKLELEKRYGQYDNTRRITTGILQADDIGIVMKETLSNSAEEMMISSPEYWLTPCLVTLAAWVNDQPEVAQTALREGLKRDGEKTSLFFALISRRADRQGTALQWIRRYLEDQQENDLNRITVVVLDAFASGLFDADTEDLISCKINEWLEETENKTEAFEDQKQAWVDAISLKKQAIPAEKYTNLRKYSKTWPLLEEIMEVADLHAQMLDFLMSIFERKTITSTVKFQLDEILNSLITDFDDEEIPLRKEEKFEQLIIDYQGDEDRARKDMAIEETAFETRKDFNQLLADAAMKPESSHARVTIQKLALVLSKDRLVNAYKDMILENQNKIPKEIEITIGQFHGRTIDGKNEQELIDQYNKFVDEQCEKALEPYVLNIFDFFCLFGGAAVIVLGMLMLILDKNIFPGAIAVIAGAAMAIYFFSKRNKLRQEALIIKNLFDTKRASGSLIIREFLTEIADFRMEFAKKDGEGRKVIEYLEQISPKQYVKKHSASNRSNV